MTFNGMTIWKIVRASIKISSWHCLILVMLLIGLFMRTVNLDQPIYWVDEVATSIRISGYTTSEVTQYLATGEPLTVDDLQHYQHISGDRTWTDTFHALTQSPEHAPLYFILARLWGQQWGSSVIALRSLSVFFSLISIVALIWLCWELFFSLHIGWLAGGLLAVSPFFIAYAQEARPYSLWTLMLIVTNGALLRALRLNTISTWSGYAVSLVILLYTSLLSVFVALGFSIYGWALTKRRRQEQTTPAMNNQHRFFWFNGLGLCAFSPWLFVVISSWQTLQSNTTWMREAMDGWVMLGIWGYSLAVLIFDVPVSLDVSVSTLIKVAIALIVLGLMAYAFYTLFLVRSSRVWLCVVLLSVPTPLILIGLDLLFKEQASTAARYLIPCHLGILIAIAHLFDMKINRLGSSKSRMWWRSVMLSTIALCLISSLSHWNVPAKYQKSRNLSNPAIAAILNQAESPLLFAESGQTLDILSLSHLLDADMTIQLFSTPQMMAKLAALPQSMELFIFNPSLDLQSYIRGDRRLCFTEVYSPQQLIQEELTLSLWKVTLLS
jgi:uncharacterized membrane protein